MESTVGRDAFETLINKEVVMDLVHEDLIF